ncbi:MAG TPA: hypothetical protein VGI83_03350, partial [Gemmatimonadales bacterium]
MLAALSARPLAAQATDERAQIERFRSELGQVPDSATLKAQEADGIAHAKLDRDNAILHVQLGFIAYRLGEVTGEKQHYDDAGSEFEWAGDLKPDWPFPWYGLGLSELAQGENGSIAIENLRQVMGKDYLTKAANAFARATQADPTFAAALVDLAETALRQRVNARVDVALSALRTARRSGSMPAAAVLELGRLEREAGSDDSALAAFSAYVAQGGDSAVGLFESSRALFSLDRRADAESAYFAGARAARSDAGRAAYREDASWTASAGELAALDSLTRGGRLAAGLSRLWRVRDAESALRRGESLVEHQRRYLYAWKHFRLVSRHRHYDVTETYRSEQSTFDDRGVIYLRQGAPDRRATFSRVDIDPNESWLYIRPEGNVIFHFVARDDIDDYKLVRSAADVLGFQKSVDIQAVPGGAASAGVIFGSRSGLDRIYENLSNGSIGSGSLLAEERRRGIDAIRLGTTTTYYAPRFPKA